MEEQIQELMKELQIDHDQAEGLLKTTMASLKIREVLNK